MSGKNKHTEYDDIAKSKYFNKRWYLRKYTDVARKGVDPVLHYLNNGWKEGRNPGPKFDTKKYLEYNPDVRKANINPLLHYERNGKYETSRVLSIKRCNRFLYSLCFFVHNIIRKKKVKNILLISHELTYTGAPLSLLKAAQVLKEEGYNIITVSLVDGDLKQEFEKVGKVVISKKLWYTNTLPMNL